MHGLNDTEIAFYDLCMSVISFLFSVFVVIVPVIKAWLDRRRMAVAYHLIGFQYDHVAITFVNLSEKHINIDYWNLVWRRDYFIYVSYSEGIIQFPQRSSITLVAGQRTEIILDESLTAMFVGLHEQNRAHLYAQVQFSGSKEPKWYFLSDASLELPFWKKLFHKPQQFRFPE